MSRIRIFKCKKRGCYCSNSWILALNGFALAQYSTHAEAITQASRMVNA